ncbi:DUF6286 domain-containing protein [Streptomyces sp. NBC_01537]|uniref:DUF6286 domain-containing Asp23/Gls24 family envelope stress response protein n=1 Tax=Streptomyces sp. NBC_01537 TaxID=2903896 RepID=UPI00386F176A
MTAQSASPAPSAGPAGDGGEAVRPLPPPAARGATVIRDKAVARLTGRAAREALTRQAGASPGRGGLAAPSSSVRIRGGSARLSLSVDLPYPVDIAGACRPVRRDIAERVAWLTGMSVTEVALTVRRLVPAEKPGEDPQEPGLRTATEEPAPATQSATVVSLTKDPAETERATDGEPPPGSPAHGDGRSSSRRLWSARRVPAALMAAVVLAAAGTLLFDVVRVRSGNSAAAWRKSLADELATRPVDDVWMLTGAAIAAVLGLWLIIVALTPGLRRLLPLNAPADPDRLRALLDRKGAALLLRDAAMRVPGVSRARVRVRRRRVLARADVTFRDPRDVSDELIAALREQLRQLALAHPPRLTVRVRRPT